RERKLQRPEKPWLRTRTQFRPWRGLSGHDARRPQHARLRLAHRARPHRAALAQGPGSGAKTNPLLRLSRNLDELRRLPRLARPPRSPRHLHHPAPPPLGPKNRMRTKPQRTFRIAGLPTLSLPKLRSRRQTPAAHVFSRMREAKAPPQTGARSARPQGAMSGACMPDRSLRLRRDYAARIMRLAGVADPRLEAAF